MYEAARDHSRGGPRSRKVCPAGDDYI